MGRGITPNLATIKGKEIAHLLVHESSTEKANRVRLRLHKLFNMPYLVFLHDRQGKKEECLNTLSTIRRKLEKSVDTADRELAKLVDEDHVTMYSVHKFIKDNAILVDLFLPSTLERPRQHEAG